MLPLTSVLCFALGFKWLLKFKVRAFTAVLQSGDMNEEGIRFDSLVHTQL